MCLSCTGWPWGQPVQLAAEPTKTEYIFLDENHGFYADNRTISINNTQDAVSPSLFDFESIIPPSSNSLPSPSSSLYAFKRRIMAHFYTYQNPNPSALNSSNSGHWENPADWPRTFLYVSAHQDMQGIHPPAPVYQSCPSSSQPAIYYFAGSSSAPAGYYVNGIYYGPNPPAASTGWPNSSTSYTCYTLPTSPPPSNSPYSYAYNCSSYYTVAPQPIPIPPPTTSSWPQTPGPAQAAAAVAANAALAQMPNAPSYFVGATSAEIQAQNAVLFANLQAGQQQQQQPTQLAPYKPGSSPQFWCKELDGSWTLREYNDALKSDFPAGHWERHSTSGYYYYVRHAG